MAPKMAKAPQSFWVDCAAQTASCSKSKRCGEGWTADSGQHKGQPVCAGCAKALGVKRVAAFSSTDSVAQRTAMAEGRQVALAKASGHKANYAKALKGGTPAAVLRVVKVAPEALKGASTLSEVQQAKATAKAPAKAPAAPRAKRTARPKAKTA